MRLVFILFIMIGLTTSATGTEYPATAWHANTETDPITDQEIITLLGHHQTAPVSIDKVTVQCKHGLVVFIVDLSSIHVSIKGTENWTFREDKKPPLKYKMHKSGTGFSGVIGKEALELMDLLYQSNKRFVARHDESGKTIIMPPLNDTAKQTITKCKRFAKIKN